MNLKVTKLNKAITLGLSLPILVLNFPLGVFHPCQTIYKPPMSCCGSVNSHTERTSEWQMLVSCTCQISTESKTAPGIAVLTEVKKPDSKRLDIYFSSKTSGVSPILLSFTSSKHLNVNPNRGFSSNLKIYDLNSTYLI